MRGWVRRCALDLIDTCHTAVAHNSAHAAAQEAEWGEDSSVRSGTAASSSDEVQGLAAPRGAESGCSCLDSWDAPRRSASLPAQLGWQPRAGKGARGGSFDLHRVRAPALLPCMRVSLEIEPLDLTPRSVLDFSALASPHAVRASVWMSFGQSWEACAGRTLSVFPWQHRAGLHDGLRQAVVSGMRDC